MALKIEKPGHVKQIAAQDDPKVLQKNLGLLCEKAKQAGAADTVVIGSDQIAFNPAIIENIKSKNEKSVDIVSYSRNAGKAEAVRRGMHW